MGLADVRAASWVCIGVVVGSSLLAAATFWWLSMTTPQIIARFQGDWALIKRHALKVVLLLLAVTYIQTVFRNVAYYRHTQVRDLVRLNNVSYNDVEPRLHDLGFDVFPDLASSNSVVAANDVLQYAFLWMGMYVGAIPYALDALGEPSPVMTSHMFLRIFYAYAIGLMVRCPVTIATSLPGPAAHCIGQAADDRRPTSVASLFDLRAVGRNCGDLLYSGHMFTATTLLCGCIYYLRKMVSHRHVVVVATLGGCLYVAQLSTVVLSRSHYTVDIILGMIVGFYNWIAGVYFFPADEDLPLEKKE